MAESGPPFEQREQPSSPTETAKTKLTELDKKVNNGLLKLSLAGTPLFGFLSGVSAASGDVRGALIAGALAAGSAWAANGYVWEGTR